MTEPQSGRSTSSHGTDVLADDVLPGAPGSPAQDGTNPPPCGGWTTLFRGKNKTIWVIALVAVVCIAVGFGLAQVITSPAQAALDAEPPVAGNITAPVEMRELSNEVVVRGDVKYDDATAVKIEIGEVKGSPVITGHVPAVGDTVEPGGVLLEIAGRPVLAVPGEIAVYRTLRIGMRGPDVTQLKRALAGLGLDPGNVDSDEFDARCAQAVVQLYQKAGYQAPTASDEDRATYEAAQKSVAASERSVTEAQKALDTAKGGPSTVERLQADAAVNTAQRTVDTLQATADDAGHVVANAQQAYDQAVASGQDTTEAKAALDAAKTAQNQARVDLPEAQDNLAIAHAQRDALTQNINTSSEQSALQAARDQLTADRDALTKAAELTQPFLPSSEIVYVKALPARVDAVNATLGAVTTGADVLTLSGATLEITASASKSDSELLKPGDTAELSGSGITGVTATISKIEAKKADGGEESKDPTKASRSTITFSLPDLTEEQVQSILGANVKLTIPVASTGGEVKSVPIAGLSMGPTGASRVEVQRADGTTELINVETGLSASGFAEIKSSEKPLEIGDLIVVGK